MLTDVPIFPPINLLYRYKEDVVLVPKCLHRSRVCLFCSHIVVNIRYLCDCHTSERFS